MDNQPAKAIKLFYCYAHEDKFLRDELEKHLGLLKRQGFISTWSDQEIMPGELWEQTISINLQAADIVLLLVSPDFMASDYCYGTEMQHALERHMCGEVQIVPIILRPVYWENAPFSCLQALPSEGKPVITDTPRPKGAGVPPSSSGLAVPSLLRGGSGLLSRGFSSTRW